MPKQTLKTIPKHILLEDNSDHGTREVKRASRQKARLAKRAMDANNTRYGRLKPRERRGKYNKFVAQFLKVLPGTHGIISTLAGELGCSRAKIEHLLQREGKLGDKVRRAYNAEVEAGLDKAERKIHDIIDQDKDIAISAQTAKWLLSRRRREKFAENITHTHEGGANPIKVAQLNIDVILSELPVDLRRQVLQAMDAKEKKLLEQQENV